MPQNRWRPGLRPGPRWGSLNAPPNPPVATLGALPLEPRALRALEAPTISNGTQVPPPK
jgi:hypothetical protein